VADGPFGLDGLDCVPTTHEVIHNHSKRAPHAKFVWITKTSTVDKDGKPRVSSHHRGD
jgi:hypothetical protein